MVEYSGSRLDRVFAALSDPTRRAILSRLRRGPSTVTEIAEPFDVSLTAVSKHVRVLEEAGLLRREIRGREHRCSLQAAPLQQASRWMEEYRVFWEQRLDALEEFLRSRRKGSGGRR